jgi:hypothetical protein
MHRVHRQVLALVLAMPITATAALAQERPAGGRVELGAFPGGFVLFTRSSEGAEPDFASYTIGTSVIWNATRRIGCEAEGFFGIGGRKSVTFDRQLLRSQAMPDVIAYSGNVIVSPLGGDRRLVPYGAAGVGGLQLLQREGTETIGITDTRTLLTANLGGGLKWHAGRGLGLRADYRLTAIRASDQAPAFFGRYETRYAHRVYAALFTTF